MRLFYLSGSIVPSRAANSVNVMKMSNAFAARGCDVTLFVRRPHSNYDEPFELYGVEPRFRIVANSWPRIPALGGQWYARSTMISASELAMPDLCYGRHVASLLRAAHAGLRTRLEVHAPPESILQDHQVKRLFSQPSFEALVCISEALSIEYRRRYPVLQTKRVIVAHDGADAATDDEDTVRLTKGRPGAPRVGYVGHLYRGKGMEVIVQMAQRLTNVDFHVVGGVEKDIELWQRTYPLPNLLMHGHVSHRQVHSVLRSFDVLLAPYQHSVSVMGGRGNVADWMSPLKIFEYMAAGRAMVVSDLPVLREIIEDGVNGVLVPPCDIDAWCAALGKLLAEKAAREAMACRARDTLVSRFTWYARASAVLS